MIIRFAIIDDVVDVYNWRNDALSMSMSLDQSKISLKAHTLWFKKKLQNDDTLMFIIEINNKKASVIRFEKKNNSTEVSINLNPDFRRKGLASKMLAISEEEMRKHWNLKTVIAKIKAENIPSTKIFKKCNFQLVSTDQGILTYEK